MKLLFKKLIALGLCGALIGQSAFAAECEHLYYPKKMDQIRSLEQRVEEMGGLLETQEERHREERVATEEKHARELREAEERNAQRLDDLRRDLSLYRQAVGIFKKGLLAIGMGIAVGLLAVGMRVGWEKLHQEDNHHAFNPRGERTVRIALVGDNFGTDFQVRDFWKDEFHLRTDRQGGWFLDVNSSSARGAESYTERTAASNPEVRIEAQNLSRPQAMVDGVNRSQENLKTNLSMIDHFSKQVDELQKLDPEKFPDVIFVNIGSNNLDWADEIVDPLRLGPQALDSLKADLTRNFGSSFENELTRLGTWADTMVEHPVKIVVLGLMDFESFFASRNQAHRSEDRPGIENYQEFSSWWVDPFTSLKGPYQRTTIELAGEYNLAINAAVNAQAGLHTSGRVSFVYSDAISSVRFSPSMLAEDGWHLSSTGQNAFAESVYHWATTNQLLESAR